METAGKCAQHTPGGPDDRRSVGEKRASPAFLFNKRQLWQQLAEFVHNHAEYVEKNTAELDKEYEDAYGILISENQEAELETLKVDMYVNGGYGDETADSAAFNRMAELERRNASED